MKMILKVICLVFALLQLTSCDNDSEEMDALIKRLENAENQIIDQDKKNDDAVQLLEDGKCTVETKEDEETAVLVCGDGSSFEIINGKNGQDGVDGTNGTDGVDGINGIDGKDGSDGKDGVGCAVSAIDESDDYLIECGEGDSRTTAILSQNNEVKSLVEVVELCENNKFDEVLLRFSDGTVLGHYASGKKQFLTVLLPGRYRTTDGYSCTFTVNEDGTIN